MAGKIGCPKCDGKGYIFITDDEGYTCSRKCECLEAIEAQERLERLGLSEEFKTKNFGNYIADSDQAKRARHTAMMFVKNFKDIRDERRNSILFMGNPGSGKTHLCIAIMINLIKTYNAGVVYMQYRDAITALKRAVTDEYNYRHEMDKYLNAPVLMIDDLFKGRITDADVNIMFELINYRYLKNRPMIISTEFTQEKLLEFDEAIASRIIEMSKDYIVEFRGQEMNYRLRNKDDMYTPEIKVVEQPEEKEEYVPMPDRARDALERLRGKFDGRENERV